MRFIKSGIISIATVAMMFNSSVFAQDAAKADQPRRFGVAAGGETGGEHARIYPYLKRAGVSTIRAFPEWPNFQPAPGQWRWEAGDTQMESARKSDLEVAGMLMYLAPFASSEGDSKDHGIRTRTFPVKDMQYWRDYVTGVVGRYKNDVHYWEVYNEFNSKAFARNATVDDYVKLVRDAYTCAKAADPNAKIGIGCADVDMSFLEQVITKGGADHFDFINVHPYSLMDAAMNGHETIFLRLGDNLRKMLAKTKQRPDIELWVSEIGRATHSVPAEERRQAEALVKAFTMCFAMDIQRVYWFEAKGPQYGKGGDFGLLRDDWSERPSYAAMRNITTLLGGDAKYAGWHDANGGKSYGFVFEGNEKPVLVTWATAASGDKLRFSSEVTVFDIEGDATKHPAGQELPITREPVFITDLPAEIVTAARANAGKPFPWLKDFSTADKVSVTMGTSNVESGVVQQDKGDGLTVVELIDGSHVRRTDKSKNRNYMYFDVDDSYVSLGDTQVEITLTVKRANPKSNTSFGLTYEGQKGYTGTREKFAVPGDDKWHEATFKIDNANFANNWGWNFRIDMSGSNGDVLVKEVVVKRVGAKK